STVTPGGSADCSLAPAASLVAWSGTEPVSAIFDGGAAPGVTVSWLSTARPPEFCLAAASIASLVIWSGTAPVRVILSAETFTPIGPPGAAGEVGAALELG